MLRVKRKRKALVTPGIRPDTLFVYMGFGAVPAKTAARRHTVSTVANLPPHVTSPVSVRSAYRRRDAEPLSEEEGTRELFNESVMPFDEKRQMAAAYRFAKCLMTYRRDF